MIQVRCNRLDISIQYELIKLDETESMFHYTIYVYPYIFSKASFRIDLHLIRVMAHGFDDLN